MPEFPKPRVRFTYDPAAEIARLRRHRRVRGVPPKAAGEVLVATWNVANFGAQARRDADHQLIAEVLRWFDVTALQECRSDYGGLFDVLYHLNGRRLAGRYAVVMSDVAGNDERMAFVYDRRKLTLLEEVGEIAYPVSELARVRVQGVAGPFAGFDRTPYLASFQLGRDLSVQLVNVHLYYGRDDRASRERRALETAAVARWAGTRRRSRFLFGRELVALGDFNMPKPGALGPGIVHAALTQTGLVLPAHATRVPGTDPASETAPLPTAVASDNQYDQVAYFPATSRRCLVAHGVYDFDTVIFPELWQRHPRTTFTGYLRYYLSDHRPLWLRLRFR